MRTPHNEACSALNIKNADSNHDFNRPQPETSNSNDHNVGKCGDETNVPKKKNLS